MVYRDGKNAWQVYVCRSDKESINKVKAETPEQSRQTLKLKTMSTLRNCYVTINNTNNPYPLVLQQITYQEGTFSPSLFLGPNPTTVPAYQNFNLSIDASAFAHGADGTLVWSTGPSDAQATVTTNFQNALTGTNIAQLQVTGSPDALMAYGGVSYFYVAVGTPEPELMRDYIPFPGIVASDFSDSYPLYITYYIVRNSFVDTPANYLPGVKNVVMLMLENRSLDHLLGQIYTENNRPAVVYPEGSSADFAGVGANPTFANTDSSGNTVTAYPLSASQNPDTPDPDPGEDFENVQVQLNYNNQPMGGFLENYEQQNVSYPGASQIMGFYTPADIPVLSGLATQYAVSDAWFCSVPTQTYANRAFSIAGTSAGNVDNSENGHYIMPYEMRTMFNVLADSGDNDWAIFYQDSWLTGDCFTTYQFSAIGDDPLIDESQQVQPIANFISAAEAGTLPAFSYLEPAWYAGTLTDPDAPWNGNDYHPPGNIPPGESMLNTIYTALTSNAEAWANTLFIVTFDEHGGTFDQVTPPSTIAPDPQTTPAGYAFNTLGVRVPTLLISPLIQGGMVFRAPGDVPFDHTSFIRTILGWRGIDVSAGVMGARAAQAPDFSGVLSSIAVNSAVRKFTPKKASPEAMAAYADKPLTDIQKAMMPALAHSVTGGKAGNAEHVSALNAMKACKTPRELKACLDAMKKQKAGM